MLLHQTLPKAQTVPKVFVILTQKQGKYIPIEITHLSEISASQWQRSTTVYKHLYSGKETMLIILLTTFPLA